MKLSQQFVLREIAGEYIVVPTGEEAVHFHGLIALNETGVLLFKSLQESSKTIEQLTSQLCDLYEIDYGEAKADVQEFIQIIKDRGMLSDE